MSAASLMIISLLRPRITRWPATGSTVPMSPVRNQPYINGLEIRFSAVVAIYGDSSLAAGHHAI